MISVGPITLSLVQEVMSRSKPAVIIVELHPHAVESTGYEGGALRLLQQMVAWGYTHISHSGSVSSPESLSNFICRILPMSCYAHGCIFLQCCHWECDELSLTDQ